MRHLEIRDLWLQKEVRENKIRILKVPGEENPADLMTKILNTRDIEKRLRGMNLEMMMGDDEKNGGRETMVGCVSDETAETGLAISSLTQPTIVSRPPFFSSSPIIISKFIPLNLFSISRVFKIFVIRSAGFSSPGTFNILILFSLTSFCSHKSLISRCLIRPNPRRLTKLFAALLSVDKHICGDNDLNPSSFAKVSNPFARVAASIIPYNSASAELNAYAP
jgi:hypothetical protein